MATAFHSIAKFQKRSKCVFARVRIGASGLDATHAEPSIHRGYRR